MWVSTGPNKQTHRSAAVDSGNHSTRGKTELSGHTSRLMRHVLTTHYPTYLKIYTRRLFDMRSKCLIEFFHQTLSTTFKFKIIII